MILIAVGLVFITALMAAQEELSPEQKRALNNEKLVVEAFGQGFGGIGATGTINVTTWTSWIAYKGFSQISEAEFFSVAGYEREAENAISFHETGVTLRIAGFSLLGIGLISSLGIGMPTDSDVFIWGGLISVLAGAVPTMLGMLRLNQNRYPYTMASDIAEEFNAFLIRELKKQ